MSKQSGYLLWLQTLNEVLILCPLMTHDAGLLAALFQVGHQRIGESSVRPRDDLQSLNRIIVKGQPLGDYLFSSRGLSDRLGRHNQTDRLSAHLIRNVRSIIILVPNQPSAFEVVELFLS
jgi:hypothetical protein